VVGKADDAASDAGDQGDVDAVEAPSRETASLLAAKLAKSSLPTDVIVLQSNSEWQRTQAMQDHADEQGKG
jgi:hypothetical protein